MLPAMLVLMLCWTNDSDAPVKTATSSTPAASARSMPFALGTSAAYRVADPPSRSEEDGTADPPSRSEEERAPGRRAMPAITSLASASCGMALGLTNEVASTTGKPAALSLSMKAILSAVDTTPFSFWRPSRGPTSTTVTRWGRLESMSVAMIALLTRGKETRLNTKETKETEVHGVMRSFLLMRRSPRRYPALRALRRRAPRRRRRGGCARCGLDMATR